MFHLMITIHSLGLAALIDNRQPLDLIDVRTEQEFKGFHIRGARSVPLGKLSAPRVLQDRKQAATEPLYIICSSRVRAGLAAGILTGAGCRRAVVVDGGMDTWMRQGLSVVRKKRFWNFAHDCFCRGLIGVTRGFAFVISGLFCAVSSMVVSFERSLETKLDMVNPIPSKPR
jgi:rhodanese-related sulfurtransferase